MLYLNLSDLYSLACCVSLADTICQADLGAPVRTNGRLDRLQAAEGDDAPGHGVPGSLVGVH